jgi:hypothetical protein
LLMRHPNKEIESVLEYARKEGWTVEKASGHAWGRLKCPWNDPGCRQGVWCQESIFQHARRILLVTRGLCAAW